MEVPIRTILIIGMVWPEPKSSAAGSRILQLIHTFSTQVYKIIFASASEKTPLSKELSSLGVEEVTIELNSDSFNDFLKAIRPDVVLFDRFITEEQFGWKVAEICPDALRILDTEDLHFLRKARELTLKKQEGVNMFDQDITKREIASIFRSDLSLIISEAEMKLLGTEFSIPSQLLLYLPFMIDASGIGATEKPDIKERRNFITIGNFRHAPNYDSICYLKEIIWPLIRKQLPEAELHIYGSYSSHKIEQLTDVSTGFLVKGFAPEVAEVMNSAKVCLAPLRFGAGLKGKLVDAMCSGTPCVMSSVAAEGIFGDMEANGFVEDDPQKFADKAVFLYNNSAIWKQKNAICTRILFERFLDKEHSERFLDAIDSLSNNLKSHREKNFIGQMLLHHQLQSTKYLGKWIEVKNKNSQT